MSSIDTSLRSLGLAPCYRKGRDNIAVSFYVPCLENSETYDRAVGYFRSSIYAVGWAGLRKFLDNNGRLRVICSPNLDTDDILALTRGYQNRETEALTSSLKLDIDYLTSSMELRRPTELLATLVALERLDFRVVVISDSKSDTRNRLFHDKVGIFRDQNGDSVVFKGSMNETWNGLSSDGNLESIDVYVSWGDDRESFRVREEDSFFEALWDGFWPGTRVFELPDAVRKDLLVHARPGEIDALISAASEQLRSSLTRSCQSHDEIIPLPHQVQALESWNTGGRRGVLHHATGSGKTITALLAVQDALRRHNVVVILVPSRLLLQQWSAEIKRVLGPIEPSVLLCGDTNDDWKSPGRLGEWTRVGSRPRIVLAINQTASDPRFLGRVRFGEHVMVVADEVHRLGSQRNRNILNANWGDRLGLSATPDRAGDAEGTAAIRSVFGNDVEPIYGLADAINDNRLCRYFYRPELVQLTNAEEEEWQSISKYIAKLMGSTSSDGQWDENVKRQLIKRARIVKKASGKIDLAAKVVREEYVSGDRWLIYCEDLSQMNKIVDTLRQQCDCRVFSYHSAMKGDPTTTISMFENSGGIIVSIRCLDEGVDIPAANKALILASSQNPREFIQRRGRVLRTAPGKSFATIFDAIVVPQNLGQDSRTGAIIRAEMARSVQFGQSSENPVAIDIIRARLLAEGIDILDCQKIGLEEDDEGDGEGNEENPN